jgi:hypothetical protein
VLRLRSYIFPQGIGVGVYVYLLEVLGITIGLVFFWKAFYSVYLVPIGSTPDQTGSLQEFTGHHDDFFLEPGGIVLQVFEFGIHSPVVTQFEVSDEDTSTFDSGGPRMTWVGFTKDFQDFVSVGFFGFSPAF